MSPPSRTYLIYLTSTGNNEIKINYTFINVHKYIYLLMFNFRANIREYGKQRYSLFRD